MKPSPFDYVAPDTVAEAVALLSGDVREAKVLAGGQSLVPMLSMRLARPELLVDITRIPGLGEHRVGPGGELRIGAAVRQATAAADPELRTGWPLLAAAIDHIGHPQIRHRGTVCGSLAHHDPAAELPAAATALDARFVLAGPAGTRTVPAAEFFVATFETALADDELLTEVVFPAQSPGRGWAFEELTRRHGDFATVGVCVVLDRTADTASAVRIVFCGAGATPVRFPPAEAVLTGTRLDADTLADAAAAVREHLNPPGDVHASAEYRREAAAHLLTRAVTTAWERTR